MKKDKFYTKLKHVNEKIEGVDKRDRPHGYAILIVILGVVVSSLLFLGVKDTGYVVFSEDTTQNTAQSFFVQETGTVTVRPPIESPKSLWLTGEVFGKGKAEVYLVTAERMYLVYYFEGDATQGKEFENMCVETCFSDKVKEGSKMYFKLEGTSIRVDNIRYISPRLIEFSLEPKELTISESTFVDVKLTNRQHRDFDVFLYVDGPLSDSFSWQGSVVHMSAEDEEKVIPVRVVVPEGLQAGEYPNKITARYVPPGDKEFVGSAPVDEMIVTVKV
ncbi:TPA: hypothetical protein HA265_05580 [Candidatus Woesearchaeota archaeon]|nr:hypothetical protein [Candidatus Woesearchaeota archaeon]